jgi:hypothetical protein
MSAQSVQHSICMSLSIHLVTRSSRYVEHEMYEQSQNTGVRDPTWEPVGILPRFLRETRQAPLPVDDSASSTNSRDLSLSQLAHP